MTTQWPACLHPFAIYIVIYTIYFRIHRMDSKQLFASQERHIQRLNELVKQSIREEESLILKILELESDKNLNVATRVADKVAEFGGSWRFILAFLFFIVLWIGLNVFLWEQKRFDPYPFIFLNLILSCIAALQAPVIMMSQNRQEQKDRKRSRSDYMINLKSELEIRGLHSKIDLLIADEMKTLFHVQQTQIDILLAIQKKLEC